jgi:hypothetical protein
MRVKDHSKSLAMGKARGFVNWAEHDNSASSSLSEVQEHDASSFWLKIEPIPWILAVLRIRDVFPDSGSDYFPSRIRIPDPDPGSASKNLSTLTQKMEI